MLKLSAKIIRRTPSNAKILEADCDDSMSTMELNNDSTSSFNISSLPSSLHWRESLSTQSEANQRNSSQDKPKKSTSFGDITIREHPMIVGDSICHRGVPLTVDWEAQSEIVLKVEDYEEFRPERRRGEAMRMPADVRWTLAMESGCTLREVRCAIFECERIRKERRSSLPKSDPRSEPMSEKWSRIRKVMMASTGKSFMKLVRPTGSGDPITTAARSA
jgi:hypothetical protein